MLSKVEYHYLYLFLMPVSKFVCLHIIENIVDILGLA